MLVEFHESIFMHFPDSFNDSLLFMHRLMATATGHSNVIVWYLRRILLYWGELCVFGETFFTSESN
jgi:hypothetical protein